ncbi:MAG: methyltransferase domain-containing protein, partial [Ignavibacteriales bacterium]|nr:methyltransferase domain-containing protein [Ignavibacteriales bacterium]
GTGFPLIELSMRLGKSSNVFGIEPWSEAVDKVRKKIDYYQLKNVKIIEGFAESIPLDNNSVDLIVSNNGINNVNNIDKTFYECSRVIKKGGQFIFTFNTDRTMIEFYSEFGKILKKMKLWQEIDLMHAHIIKKRPPVKEVLRKLEKNKFKIYNFTKDQFNYKYVNGTAMLNHYFIRLAFMDSWKALLPSDKVELVFNVIEERLNKKSKVNGGINLSIPFVLINSFKD